MYAERAPELYRSVDRLDHTLAMCLHSSAIVPTRIETGAVISHGAVVFSLDDFASLAILSSSTKTVWSIRYTGTIGAGIRYAPSDAFLTFPRPASSALLETLGERLDTDRSKLMLSRSWGLTTTYNHIHEPADRDPAVVALRDLHSEIDHAVMDAYGWDLDLEIGHHATKIGTRWTASPRARFELLDLLLEENHRRAGYRPDA